MAPPAPRPPVPPPAPGQRPQKAMALGSSAARAAAAFYRGWRSGRAPSDPIELERQRQAARYAAALGEYRSRANALRARAAAGYAGVAAGAVVASAALSGLPDAPFVVAGGSAAVLGAWQVVRGRRGLQDLAPPRPPIPIAAPPVPLPPGSTAAAQSARVAALRSHIIELLPTIEMLHPTAADDVLAADAATAPGLHAIVERTRSMQRIIDQMPGSPAAASAQLSIEAMTIRLSEGAAAYQELLDAVIALSAAPAITGGPGDTLRPAITDMHAYAAGLESAARTWQ